MAVAAEIVLTGGPCGGKTTAMSYLTEKIAEWGYRVLVVPEVATMFIEGGLSDISRIAVNAKLYADIEAVWLETQRSLRRHFRAVAEALPEQCVILYDRAELDVRAYIGSDRFAAIMDDRNWTWGQLRDSYDAVIHLVTAADGAAMFYTLANNRARRESVTEAISADRRTLNAWIGHPHLRVVDNSTVFEVKLKRVLQHTARVLGVPVPLEIERKFLLDGPLEFTIPEMSAAQRVGIEQVYLRSKEREIRRVRKRSQEGQATYYLTTKTEVGGSVRQETESRIRASQYLDFLEEADPQRQIVRKDRWCFVWRSQYFELDVVTQPTNRSCILLEIELTEENDKVELPPFLQVVREVTGESEYRNYNIALG